MKAANYLYEYLITVQRPVEPPAGTQRATDHPCPIGLPPNGVVVFTRLVSGQKWNEKSKAVLFLWMLLQICSCKHLGPEICRPYIIRISEALPWLLQAQIPTFQGWTEFVHFNLAWEKMILNYNWIKGRCGNLSSKITCSHISSWLSLSPLANVLKSN